MSPSLSFFYAIHLSLETGGAVTVRLSVEYLYGGVIITARELSMGRIRISSLAPRGRGEESFSSSSSAMEIGGNAEPPSGSRGSSALIRHTSSLFDVVLPEGTPLMTLFLCSFNASFVAAHTYDNARECDDVPSSRCAPSFDEGCAVSSHSAQSTLYLLTDVELLNACVSGMNVAVTPIQLGLSHRYDRHFVVTFLLFYSFSLV